MKITAWKVPVFGVFLVCIILHLDWTRKDIPYLSVFSPNAGKYGPEKLQIGHFSRSELNLVVLILLTLNRYLPTANDSKSLVLEQLEI